MRIPCDICINKGECEYEKDVRNFLSRIRKSNAPFPLLGEYICQKSAVCRMNSSGKIECIPIDKIEDYFGCKYKDKE